MCLSGHNSLGSTPWVLVEDLSSVFNDIEPERLSGKHAHKKRKLADGREKTMVRVTEIYERQTETQGHHVYQLYTDCVCRVLMMRTLWGRDEEDTFWSIRLKCQPGPRC